MKNYKSKLRVNILIQLLLFLVVILCTFISLDLGVEKIDWNQAFISGTLSNTILFKSRLPRTISILISGFSMSIVGLIFQKISRNKFVSPTTSGAVSGAQLGVAVSLVFFSNANTAQMMTLGFLFSLGVTFLFMGILNKLKFKEIIYIPLLGLMLGSLVTSITTLLAYKFNFLQILQGWFYGSFSLVITGRYEILYIAIPALVVTVMYAKAFTITGLGENFSKNLGLNYTAVINIGLVLISVVSASVVIVVGSLPFLGLVVPNIISIYKGDSVEKNITLVGLVGVLFLLGCDILSRLIIFPYELPVALVIGIIGCGVFLFLILRRGGNLGES